MAGWRPAYTLKEDCKILRYIVDGGHIMATKGEALWKRLEEQKLVPNRTWQSMRNRWLKTISKNVGRLDYELTTEEKTELISKLCELNHVAPRRPSPVNRRNQIEESELEISTDEEPEPPTAEKQKQFYSLDKNWSDDDTE